MNEINVCIFLFQLFFDTFSYFFTHHILQAQPHALRSALYINSYPECK